MHAMQSHLRRGCYALELWITRQSIDIMTLLNDKTAEDAAPVARCSTARAAHGCIVWRRTTYFGLEILLASHAGMPNPCCLTSE